MEVVYLDYSNIDDYADYLTPDQAENISRVHYIGIVVTKDEEPVAGMIWKLRTIQEVKESHIVFLRIDDEAAEETLFGFYRNNIIENEVERSTFSLPALSSANEKAALRKEGFSVGLMEGDIIRSRLADVSEITLMKQIKPGSNIKALSELERRDFNSAIRRFVKIGMFGLCEDLLFLQKSYYENGVSCFAESEDDVGGLLLFHKTPSGALFVVFMGCFGENYGRILPQMMAKSLESALDFYEPETEICIDRHNYSTLALTEKLFPSSFGIPEYQGMRKEI